jgi:hypothetical protein
VELRKAGHGERAAEDAQFLASHSMAAQQCRQHTIKRHIPTSLYYLIGNRAAARIDLRALQHEPFCPDRRCMGTEAMWSC